MNYDLLVVGSGLFGAVTAYKAKQQGLNVLVVEKRHHLGGNIYCEDNDGIKVHKYGAHIFHTSNKEVWDFVNGFVDFNRFTNSPLALSKGKLYNLPFNMNTFAQIWGVKTPKQALDIIEEQRRGVRGEPQNLEQQAIALVGKDIYELLIKEYTEKQWGRDCKDLPAFIIKRLPLRFTFDNNYFNDTYQGIPVDGYNPLIEGLLVGIDVEMNTDFLKQKAHYQTLAKEVVYTGPIDAYYDFCFGKLDYRSLHFNTQRLEQDNYQGNAVVNYIDKEVAYTRVIEHKHFALDADTKHTVISEESPLEWREGLERYYPVNDDKNMQLYKRYRQLSKGTEAVHFGGRLAEYKYYDMDKVIASALHFSKRFL
ncbi:MULTISPECIES: UDP-galactopyranose mutase [unclassified Agarivorans]|uniref:UDP-galactopyranose mutase n=1 Tax=unclassified Agarivorans TaxID=2636026 RepID=UPI0026E2CC54|nr:MULTISPECIES: UDP-galactopyranose mutase [unclassified Agarivorans]MDO6685718.1 UDP-galactopyranose mutase [Agarivorans sp. 3_MG-2023]MDO6716167.1 UDP-galactopyranose mutase [Agarivorans sp. 2_MG-2023]